MKYLTPIDVQQFGTKALKFTESVDEAVGESKVAKGSAPKAIGALARITDAKSVYPEVKFFTLGPVYQGARVDFDILQQLYAHIQRPLQVASYEFQHDIVNGIGEWSRVLQAAEAPIVEELNRFMATQVAKRDELGEYYRFTSTEVIIADPFKLDENDYIPGHDQVPITVYSVSTPTVNFIPVPQLNTHAVDLIRTAPDKYVVEEFKTLSFARDNSELEIKQFFQRGKRPFRVDSVI